MKKILFLAFLGTFFAAVSAYAGSACCGAEMATDKSEKADKSAMTEKADKAEPVAATCAKDCGTSCCGTCPASAKAEAMEACPSSCTREKADGEKTAAAGKACCPAMESAKPA